MITVFYARFAYVNPGVPHFLNALQTAPPEGLRAVNVSDHTLEEVSLFAAESSTIAIDQSIENAGTWVPANDFSIYRIRGNHPASFFAEISERLWTAGARRLFMSNFDLHDVRIPPLLEKITGKVDAISWMFEKRPLTWTEIPAQYRDPWLTPEHNPLVTWNLVRAVAPVRIELPFSLAPEEFSGESPKEAWDACVPGAPYATRRLATESIRRAGLSCGPVRTVSLLGLGVSRVFGVVLPNETASLAAIALRQRLQRTVVRSCAASFVCGSGVAFATRKFFEVPGLLAPMLAYPCVGFEDYGFSHGENVVSTIPEEAGKDARWLRSNRAAANKIARAGQEMIRKLHSLEVRVTQFAECLRRLDRGDLAGAQFRDGGFEIK
ncbi:MAG: glycosyltransferase [Gemmatimonadota bacterium]|nr:glycosyltransferase [Gemmatimonadota bacterium]